MVVRAFVADILASLRRYNLTLLLSAFSEVTHLMVLSFQHLSQFMSLVTSRGDGISPLVPAASTTTLVPADAASETLVYASLSTLYFIATSPTTWRVSSAWSVFRLDFTTIVIFVCIRGDLGEWGFCCVFKYPNHCCDGVDIGVGVVTKCWRRTNK